MMKSLRLQPSVLEVSAASYLDKSAFASMQGCAKGARISRRLPHFQPEAVCMWAGLEERLTERT
jgi:hypothetical protein